jgi:hypothetical protein
VGFLLGGLAALALVILGVLLLARGLRISEQPQQLLAPVSPTLEGGVGDRSVVLVFPGHDGLDYVTEERRLPSRNRLEDDLLAVMGALCDGPTVPGAQRALPAGTRPLVAFYDEATGSVVVDFSHQLVTEHPGGSASEYATLATILRTVALNFPEVRLCTLLVDGAESETLAGHLTMDHPFEPRRWL